MAKKKSPHDEALLHLRAFGLAYPGAHKKAPWPDHWDLAVNDKTFAYMSKEGEPLSLSCRLPDSSEEALMLPGTSPTGYGLGKWGWVTISFAPDEAIPVEMLEAWLDESYRRQAPKKLLKQLDATTPAAAPEKTAKKKTAKKKTAKKR
ncbi:MAG: hypothetical protein SangKO_023150 [Sandaracinaceae bacterium]